MRLFEAIVDANHRALAGDERAGLRPSEFAESLPVVALTCIDPRLNPLMPEVLGVPEEKFIWLRNAGNIITSSSSSTMRSVALACAVKGGREIAIIGHTDCLVGKTSMMELTNRFKVLGVERAQLPENLNEFFGLFASERQNVIRGVEFIRASPFIGSRIPVHGLIVDIQTGRLEWLVNGYQALDNATSVSMPVAHEAPSLFQTLNQMAPFDLGEMKFPESKIGEAAAQLGQVAEKVEHFAERAEQVAEKIGDTATKASRWLSGLKLAEPNAPAPPPRPPSAKFIPKPPPIRSSPGKHRPT